MQGLRFEGCRSRSDTARAVGMMDFEHSLEQIAHLNLRVVVRRRGFHLPCGHTDRFNRQFNLNLAPRYETEEELHAIDLNGTDLIDGSTMMQRWD